MLGRIETALRRLRRNLSRSVWLARLLRLPVSEGAPTRPGLIMIQIDGLSQMQFEHAMDRGKLPFLRRLMRRENYQIHAHYSGLPATTPAFQAELFYGVRGAVPAFAFRDHESHRILRMFEPEAAARVEALYGHKGNESLLKGGSVYADVYTGGADAEESHFCPSALGWGTTLRSARLRVLLLFVISNLYSFVRIAGLLLLELGLALVDFVRGISRGHDFINELRFIPTRVAISILLRELCVIGTKIDISRGLPIIHLNFLGYDEQAHRRGPRSLFAHWTLKGIDDAISRIWHAANHSRWRNYDLWVYSDHGQASVRSYLQRQGYTLELAVKAAFAASSGGGAGVDSSPAGGIQTQRARFLGGYWFQRLFAIPVIHGGESSEEQAVIAALGPVGHVYSPRPLAADERDCIARELAQTHRVPVVLTVEGPGQLCAWTEEGVYPLPQEFARLFGPQHPFIDAIGEDLLRLCQHADAGDFVLLGWRQGVSAMTFASENGAHGGVSPQETNGFALLPEDAPLTQHEHPYLRPEDLRNGALQQLHRRQRQPATSRERPVAATTRTLRVMTYNVHSCIGMDGKHDVERIARVIARARPDVVALQELDMGRARSQGVDQARLIARYLEMEFHFHPALHLEEERYGDAILTHLPLRLVRAGALPGLAGRPKLEPRGALWVAIDLHGSEVQVINTHLGLSRRERMTQATALLGSDWLAHENCSGPVILCGDFNALPSSRVCRRISDELRDVQVEARYHRPKGTFSGRLPAVRIDHIFIGSGIEVSGIEIPATELARTASDHRPLLAELRIPARAVP